MLHTVWKLSTNIRRIIFLETSSQSKVCPSMLHTVKKLSTRVITFLETSSQLEVCIKNYGLQSCRSPNFGNFRTLDLGVSKQNDIREYCKGEGGSFPQVRAVVSLVSLCLPMAYSCTKNVQTMH
jgi:hypothetical protein